MSESATLWTVPTSFLSPWNSPGKKTGVLCHFFLQEILTQGSSLCSLHLLHCRWILYPLNHLGNPKSASPCVSRGGRGAEWTLWMCRRCAAMKGHVSFTGSGERLHVCFLPSVPVRTCFYWLSTHHYLCNPWRYTGKSSLPLERTAWFFIGKIVRCFHSFFNNSCCSFIPLIW